VFNENWLQNATKGYEKMLGDQLRKEPKLLVSNSFGAVENVLNHRAAYPGVCKKDLKHNDI